MSIPDRCLLLLMGTVKLIVSGSHTGDGSLMTTVGIGFTFKIKVAIESHPAAFVSVAEYVPGVV
jgi:hypothetical protein